jgi:hypothetical protein
LDSLEGDAQVFIVRFWHETREIGGAHPILRGSVEHVPSGQRVYVKSIKEVDSVLSSFVPEAGKTKRSSEWKKRIKSHFPKKKKNRAARSSKFE